MPTESMTVAVFGASGAVGRHVVRRAHGAGHRVRALEPDWPDRDDLPDDIERRRADVLRDDLAPHLEGVDAVLSCIGVGLSARAAIDPPPLYTQGTDAMIRAMRATGVRRILVISASFVATYDRGPPHFRAAAATALSRIFAQMGEMEHRLRGAGDLDWTAVRPGWLMAGEASGEYTVSDEVIPKGMIRTRHADLADFMVGCAEAGTWIRRTPAIAAPEPPRASNLQALLSEMAG